MNEVEKITEKQLQVLIDNKKDYPGDYQVIARLATEIRKLRKENKNLAEVGKKLERMIEIDTDEDWDDLREWHNLLESIND